MEHPNKGKKLDVAPIRSMACIRRIERNLEDKPRDLLLFVLGCNNGIRCADLLRLTCGRLREYHEPGDWFEIVETKTGKSNIMVVNEPVARAIKKYFAAYPDRNGDDPVFFSKKTGRAVTKAYAGDLIQSWAKEARCPRARYGAHTLRKTWGYMARTRHGISWEQITERYRHSSPAITRAYLGFTRDEVVKTLMVPITGGRRIK